MLKLFFSSFAVLFGAFGFFNKENSVANTPREIISCHPIATGDDMAVFANDPAFVAMHLSPLPINYAAQGESISFPAPDGTDAKGYIIKAKKKSRKWLFVYQEWWGVNDYVKKQADIFYNDLNGEVNVLALDMYDGKVTTDPKEAGQIMQSVVETRLENIVKAGMNFAGKKAKIANVGWCFGGGWSLKSAIITDKQNVGSVMYYGMPVKDVEKLKKLNSDVLGLFATENFISKQVIEEFAANMKSAGKKLDYKIFDAVHGFANPSNPKHDEAKAKEAYGMAIAYLKGKFKVS
ncbi:MAG: dienelactone hydrolase family protein [Chitinophagaceae bacterium]|nr:dienelactone hydrolase family protein [Chitinophagaceae bacterium]